MLVINILYRGKNGSAKKFAEEMVSSGIVDLVRKEEGNLGYSYFFPMEDEETVLLIGKWKDEEALDRHHKTDMMRQISLVREKYKLSMKVEQYISK